MTATRRGNRVPKRPHAPSAQPHPIANPQVRPVGTPQPATEARALQLPAHPLAVARRTDSMGNQALPDTHPIQSPAGVAGRFGIAVPFGAPVPAVVAARDWSTPPLRHESEKVALPPRWQPSRRCGTSHRGHQRHRDGTEKATSPHGSTTASSRAAHRAWAAPGPRELGGRRLPHHNRRPRRPPQPRNPPPPLLSRPRGAGFVAVRTYPRSGPSGRAAFTPAQSAEQQSPRHQPPRAVRWHSRWRRRRRTAAWRSRRAAGSARSRPPGRRPCRRPRCG